jgi:Fe(II)/alpha-ketoglutarate-dependent arginine beta-hydroxylase
MALIANNSAPWRLAVLECTRSEVTDLNILLNELLKRYPAADDPIFVSRSALLAHELPIRIREFLVEAREAEEFPAYLLSCPGITAGVRDTPQNWWTIEQPSTTRRQEMALVLTAALLGDIFAWATQQNGRMIHDVMPIRGHEYEQLGSGSLTPLSWHTEDAFHPFRGDYLALACLRNNGVPTTLLAIDHLELSGTYRECLAEARFIIAPDNSHLAHNNSSTIDSKRFGSIRRMIDQPIPVAAIFGTADRPYLRADPDFMSAVPGDDEAETALDHLFQAIERSLCDVVLEAGDFLFVDNFRCAHGRRAFKARYDGSDRWLKRINISRDLRPARAAGFCREFRIMY